MQTYLIEGEGRPPGESEDRTYRLAGPHAYSHPSAPGFYPGDLKDPILVHRNIIGDRTFFGASKVSVGDATVNNLGRYDELAGWAVDGREIRSLVGEDDQPYETFKRVFTGTVQQLLRGDDTLSFNLRDALALLDAPVQSSTFAGDNVGDAGVEGTEETGGKRKPMIVGGPPNCPGILVNIPKDIYQFADRAAAIAVVFAGGVPVDEGTYQATLEDLFDTLPAPATFDWYAGPEGTFVRLGFVPRYALTADLYEGADDNDRTPAQAWKRVLMDRLGIAEEKISAADIAALDLVASDIVGIWLADDRSARTLLDLIAASAGAWYGPDVSGIWRIKRIVDPAGETPIATFKNIGGGSVAKSTDFGLAQPPSPITTQDPGRGVAVWRFDLGWGINPLVQGEADLGGDRTEPDTDVVGGLERRAWLEEPIRRFLADDGAVKDLHPLAAEVSIDTALRDRAAAEALGAYLLQLFGPDREFLTVRIPFTPAATALLDLGKVIRLEVPRYTWHEGKNFLIVGIRPDASDNIIDCWIWG